jgi:uncharacterized protein with GYD domain
MAKYIELFNWTDQGIRNVKDSPSRLEAAKATAKKFGCEIEEFFMTIGPYDGVVVIEAPDDDAVAKYTLSVGAGGNIRTTTLKAFSQASFKKIIGSLS